MDPHQMPDLAHTPAAAPPPGQIPNFVDPPSQQPAMIAVSTVFMVLVFIFVSLRITATFKTNKALRAEDYVCVAATIFSIAYTGMSLSLSYVSRHMWDVPLIWLTNDYWKRRFAGNTIQAIAYFLSKLPILILYFRLFGTSRKFRCACVFGGIASFFIYITAIPLLSYFCTPRVGASWSDVAVFAKCKKLLDWAVIQGSLSIALDVYIFILPIPVISKLQLPTKKKIGVLVIFLTALLGVVVSGVGFYYRYQLSFTSDVNWNEGAYILMSIVEINIAIICSCMPACASLFRNKTQQKSFVGSLRSFFGRQRLISNDPPRQGNSDYGFGRRPTKGSQYTDSSSESHFPLSSISGQKPGQVSGLGSMHTTVYHQPSANTQTHYGIRKTVEREVM